MTSISSVCCLLEPSSLWNFCKAFWNEELNLVKTTVWCTAKRERERDYTNLLPRPPVDFSGKWVSNFLALLNPVLISFFLLCPPQYKLIHLVESEPGKPISLALYSVPMTQLLLSQFSFEWDFRKQRNGHLILMDGTPHHVSGDTWENHLHLLSQYRLHDANRKGRRERLVGL